MSTSEQFRLEETLASYQWMVDNWAMWEKLCAVQGDDQITPQEIVIIIRAIMDAKLYPLLFVFLSNYQYVKPLDDIVQQTLHSQIIANWQEDTLHRMAAEIVTRVKAQAEPEG